MSDAICKSKYIDDLFQFIEENISADFDTELLSNVGYVSRRKLYHDFYSISGHTVKEYVYKRRLSNALALIKMSDMTLTDIAFHCGYSSYLTLWRAVKQALGLTPSQYKNGNTYYFFPSFNGKPLQSVTISNETIPQSKCILLYHSRLAGIENIAVNTFLQAHPNYSGRIFGRNGKQKGSKFCYELYLSSADINYDILISHGFETANEMPCFPATIATSIVQNDASKISAAWDYLYYEWLQNSMFESTSEPYFEEYIVKNNNIAKLKLHLPIRERSEDTKITLVDNPALCFITAKATGHNAEEIASQIVMDCITVHYPFILNSPCEIFLSKDKNACVCGVKTDKNSPYFKYENVGRYETTEKHYLLLESSVMGDYDRYADMLYSFARNNGMHVNRSEIFAVYSTNDNSHNPEIKMYCPVKLCTK